MNNILKDNLDIIQKRWPNIADSLFSACVDTYEVVIENNTLLINDIQLTSNYDRKAEADLQCSRIDETSTIAYVYGTGLGDVPLCLLNRKHIKKIVVCILNMDIFFHSLNALSHLSWLGDLRVSLVTPEELNDVKHPFVALPTELHFASDKCAVLRDKLVLELNHEHAMVQHDAESETIKQQINSNITYIEKDYDVEILFNSFEKKSIFIAAAGPTLDGHIEFLRLQRQVDNLYLVALDAAVKPLLSYGIVPDVVVSIDLKADQILKNADFNALKQTKLVYFPRVSSLILNSWQGPRFCAYSYGGIYKEINKDYPREHLFTGGSVIHCAVDLAIKMGAKSVFLLGADFGFPGGKVYAEGQSYDYTQQYSNSKHWVFNGKGEKIPTMLNYRGYLRELERYIEKYPSVSFYNTSLEGAKIEGTKFFDTQSNT